MDFQWAPHGRLLAKYTLSEMEGKLSINYFVM